MQLANYALPLVTLPYLVRVLGVENFGKMAFAQAFIAFFIIITDYGFNLSATRAISQSHGDINKISSIVCSVMLIKAVLMMLGFVLMLTLVLAIPSWRSDWQLFVAVYLSVAGSALFPIWLFQGMERMLHILLTNLAARTITLIAIFIFVQESTDLVIAAGIQSSGLLITGIISWLLIPQIIRLNWKWPGSQAIRNTLKDGWHVFIATGGASLFNNSNIFILGIFTSPTVVGLFAAAEKLVKAVVGLNAPITQATYPHTAKLQSISTDKMFTFVSKLAKYQVSFMATASLFLFLLAEPLTIIILGEEYRSSIVFIQILALLPLLTAISDILGNQIMLNTGLQREFANTFILSGTINIILMIASIPAFGAAGAAFSILVTEVVLMTLRTKSLHQSKSLQRLIRKIYA